MSDKEEYTEESFVFYMPVTGSYVGDEMSKAVSSRTVKGLNLRWIEGLASTEDKDLQGEIVEQSGIDFSYVLNEGYFNDDHKSGPEHKIGEPTEIEIRTVEHPMTQKKQHGLFVKGFLYNNHTKADAYWELLKAQETTPGSKRRIGFSVQGKVRKRFGNRILNCWVQDVAITTAPINTNTWARIVKSLMLKSLRCHHADSPVCVGCDGSCHKALDAGYSIANQTGGAALRTQSLEGVPKSLLIEILNKAGIFPQTSINKFVDLIYDIADQKERMGGVNV